MLHKVISNMAKIGDWERTIWRSRSDAAQRESSLLCRWRDGPTRQRLEYHFFDEYLERHTDYSEKEVDGEDDEVISPSEQFVEENEGDYDHKDDYIILFGEEPEGAGGELVSSQPTRDAVREASSELMKTEYHPDELWPERYETETLKIPPALEDTLDEEMEIEYEYSEIQEIAKSHGVAANQSTEDLVEELVEIRDSVEA